MAKKRKPMPESEPEVSEADLDIDENGNELSSTGQWIGWGVWGSFVLIGFCFGVWVGTPKSGARPSVEVADATQTKPEPAKPEPPKPEPVKPTPVVVETPKPKPPEPKPPEPMPVVETPKPPEPKPVEKPPEPKPPEPAANVPDVSYVKDLMPIIRSSCITCHGIPQIKGGLDLRTVAAAIKGGDTGPGAKAGDLKNSAIWKSIEEGEMPPAGKTPLTAAEKLLFKNWVLSGAKP